MPLSGMSALIREDARKGSEDSQNRGQKSGIGLSTLIINSSELQWE
jgi:hypothetical protein